MTENVGALPDGTGSREPSPAVSAVPASIPSAWPSELTPDLAGILGRQCYTFIHLATTYRLAGYDIPAKAEAEQAYFLHKLVGFWFAHGAGWIDAATEELRAVHAQTASAIEAQRAATTEIDAVHESAVAKPDAQAQEQNP